MPAEPHRPLTLGTAGHIDHGKTTLVQALTGVDTDRLPEEHRRGISIELGYAPLQLPSGRRLSVIDVPGHERYVRKMVAGATGVDFFLMTVAADDGVMPQTREHATVLRALDVRRGVVAVTRSDLRDPGPVAEEVGELLPGIPVVAVSAVTRAGLPDLLTALDEVAATVPSRARAGGPPVLHVDRVFSVRGAGTVVTGTLWRGSIGRRDELWLEPGGAALRVRDVQVHDQAVDRAHAGQRVAVNVVGAGRAAVTRGAVLTSRDAGLRPVFLLDVRIDVEVPGGTRLQVHHGTRDVPARVAALGGGYHQLRLEKPLIAAPGDRLLLRQSSPVLTLGGGVVIDARVRKHGASARVVERLAALERGDPPPAEPEAPPLREPAPAAPPLSARVLELERQLEAAGFEPPLDSALDPGDLAALRAAGRAVRVGRTLHFHPGALASIEARVRTLIDAEGSVTLARLRDELSTTRKFAQAILEHFDGEGVTLRRPDDSRVLRRRAREPH